MMAGQSQKVNGRIFTGDSYENKYLSNRHTQAVIYDTSYFICCEMTALIASLLRGQDEQRGHNGLVSYLEEELHPTVIDAGDPKSTQLESLR